MKKRILLILLAMVCMTVLLLSLPVSAAQSSGTCGDSMTWVVDETVLTISGTGEMYVYDKNNMPPWWDDYHEIITKVVIEEGVTSLSHKAFVGFAELTEVEMADSVEIIGGQAFKDCTKLVSVSLPGVTTIGDFAFEQCTALEKVVFSNSLTLIDMYAFRYCSALEEISIPASVTAIYMSAFANCSSLEEVRFAGDCPKWIDMIFTNVTATAYYPCGNTTWTTEKMNTTEGDITWKAYATEASVHTEVTDAAKAATCTESGLTEGKHCSVCGEVTVAQETVEATGHSYGSWKEVKEPTTTSTGLAEKTCANCGKVEQKTLDKLPPEETKPAETEPPETEPVVTYEEVNETVYATRGVNVRSEANSSSKKLGSLNAGDAVTRTGIGDNGWSRIEYDGKVAYVYSEYLTTTVPETEPTETEPAETKPVETAPAETESPVTEPPETQPATTEPAQPETTEPVTEPVETQPQQTDETATAPAEGEGETDDGTPWGIITAAAVVFLGAAAAAVILIKKHKK